MAFLAGQKLRASDLTIMDNIAISKAHYYQAAGQAIADNSISKLSWDTTNYQTNTTLTSGTDITLNVKGLWMVYLGLRFAGSFSDWTRGVTWLALSTDSTTRYGFGQFGAGLNGVADPGVSFTVPVDVTGSSLTISAYVYQDNTANAARTTFVTYKSTELRAKYVG